MLRRSIKSRVTLLLPVAAVFGSAALLSVALYGSSLLVDNLGTPLLFRTLIVFLILSMLVMPIVFLAVRAYLVPVITPLVSFTRHVKQLSGKVGDERFFPPVGLEEIDTLGQAFNEMVQELDNRQMQARSEYFMALHETTFGLLERLDLDSLLKTILSRAAALVGTEHGYIYMVNGEGTELRMQIWSGIFEQLLHKPIRKGQGLSGRVWQSTKPLVVDDYSVWPHRINDLDRQAVHAELAVPLTGTDGAVVGVIGLAFLEPGRLFNNDQVEMLGRFAELASLALHNAGLYASIRQELEERKRLENQLRHSQRMEAVGQLAGGIAHDFNNILTAIMGYAGMMQLKLADDSPCQCGLEQIMSSAERAAALTRGLLAYSRKQVFSPKRIDINEVVRRSAHLLDRLICERIELQLLCSEQQLPVLADEGQIEQVLMNLVTNARDAMPQGGIITVQTGCISIDQAVRDDSGSGRVGLHACFSVSDKGVGMDEATVSQIFEPFFTTKEVGQGTGLGLAIASNIVEQHNGVISCQSSVGLGTRFTVCLPLHEGQVLAEEPAETGLPTGGSEAILLAEDDDDARIMTRRILEEFGYTVIEATNGDEALVKFQQYREMIALLILDVVMPKRTGIDLYRDIRSLHPKARVLFLTAYAQEDILQGGQLPEEAPCLSKPFKPGLLLRKVREVLEA